MQHDEAIRVFDRVPGLPNDVRRAFNRVLDDHNIERMGRIELIAERDRLRAELAAAKERAKALVTVVFDAHVRAFGSRHYEYVDPQTTLDLLVADVGATQHERDRFAADNARLRKAENLAGKAIHELTAFAERWAPAIPHEGSCGPESGCDGICVEIAWLGRTMRTVANWKKLHETLAATPAQSLAAHDAAIKVAVLREMRNKMYYAQTWDEIANMLADESDRIETEAANGKA